MAETSTDKRLAVVIDELVDANKNAISSDEKSDDLILDTLEVMVMQLSSIQESSRKSLALKEESLALQKRQLLIGSRESEGSTVLESGSSSKRSTESKPTKIDASDPASLLSGLGFAGLQALFIAPIIAAKAAIEVYIKDFTKAMKFLTKSLGGFFGKITGSLSKIIMKIPGVPRLLQSLSNQIDSLVDVMRIVKGEIIVIGEAFKTIGVGIVDSVKSVFVTIKTSVMSVINTIKSGLLSYFDEAVKSFTVVSDSLKNFKLPNLGIIDTVLDTTKGVFSLADEFFKVFKTFARGIGQFFGKLLLPLQIIMSALDFVNGVVDGMKDSEALGLGWFGTVVRSIGQGVIEAVTMFAALPLDLIKDLISWISEKLGFEEFSKTLDSFSFVDTMADMLTSILDFFTVTLPNMIKKFAGPIGEFLGFDTGDWVAEAEESNEKLDKMNEEKGAYKSAEKSGLIEETWNPYGNDDINRSKVEEASTAELESVLSRGDLKEEDVKYIQDELTSRSGGEDGNLDKTSGSERTTQQVVGGVVVQENGKPTKLTQKEAARVKAVNQVRVSQGNVAYDLSQNEVLPEGEKRGKTIGTPRKEGVGTLATAMRPSTVSASPSYSYTVRDALTQQIVSTHGTAEEANSVAMQVGGYVDSGVSTVSGSNSGSVSNISGSESMSTMSSNLSMEQQRLDNSKSEQGSSTNLSMISAPSSSSTVVHNTNVSGGSYIPSSDNNSKSYHSFNNPR
jgi:hypothetical protein